MEKKEKAAWLVIVSVCSDSDAAGSDIADAAGSDIAVFALVEMLLLVMLLCLL